MQDVLYRMKWVQKGQNHNLHGMLYSWFPEAPFKITKVTEYITFFQKTTRVLILSIYHDSFESFNIVPSIHSFVFSQVWTVSHLVPKLQDGLAWKSLVYQVLYCRETKFTLADDKTAEHITSTESRLQYHAIVSCC